MQLRSRARHRQGEEEEEELPALPGRGAATRTSSHGSPRRRPSPSPARASRPTRKGQSPADLPKGSKGPGPRAAPATSTTASTKGHATGPRNPRTTSYEFFGPHGTVAVMLSLPLTVLVLYQLCSPEGACHLPVPSGAGGGLAAAVWARLVQAVRWSQLRALWHLPSLGVVMGWFALHLALYPLLPGPWVQGVTLRTGERLWYKINAFGALLVTVLAGVGLYARVGLGPFLWVAEHVPQLALATMLVAMSLAVFLYAASFRRPQARGGDGGALLSTLGNSGYPLYDFWMGRELNPRTLGLDWKYVCELRPGLIGWLALNVCYALKQVARDGALSNAMALVLAFQGLYVVDALWYERSILTTMDITTDGFGFMLVFGDLVWVPFTYTLQARYLSMNVVTLSTPYVVGILLLNAAGLYIFRGANSEKNAFRSNPPGHPSIAHLRYLSTRSGSRLLITGWWGAARHINYLGDWMMGVAWCLPCAFASPLPYFYAVYFALLLIHREQRDEHKCRTKYGADWDTYCRLVPYRFLPGVY